MEILKHRAAASLFKNLNSLAKKNRSESSPYPTERNGSDSIGSIIYEGERNKISL
jgi:hypothetical protein